MRSTNDFQLLVPAQFIEAIRDSGYKSIASALAELVDNAFEAGAASVRIDAGSDAHGVTLRVSDDGEGINPRILHHALQFGWSSRFNSRAGFGRYGMGLPNASLSMARRIELYSRVRGRAAHVAVLDVDSVRSGGSITSPKKLQAQVFSQIHPFSKGTSVIWKKCDRISGVRLPIVLRGIERELGRLFRYQLWGGKRVVLNGKQVAAIDPLFQRRGGGNPSGAKAYGSPLRYEVAVPDGDGRKGSVCVQFTELPVDKWHQLSNAEKNRYGIAKNAGVAIVRAGREIDKGWFFMGAKRRENYDDWWRCEVSFDPELDEVFGVTHSKQQIRPTSLLTSILTPDMEATAHLLNSRVRAEFTRVKRRTSTRPSERQAELRDGLLAPPPKRQVERQAKGVCFNHHIRVGRSRWLSGIEYRLRSSSDTKHCFFEPEYSGRRLTVNLNPQHSFVETAFGDQVNVNLELAILAAARAELMLGKSSRSKCAVAEFRRTWSKILNAFCS